MSEQKPPQVLIVDDNRNLAFALAIGLRRAGFAVDFVGHGEEALERLAERHFDAVLADVEMPQISGLELVREVEKRYPQTSLIIMSASDKPEGLHQLPFLAKPFDLTALLGLLHG